MKEEENRGMDGLWVVGMEEAVVKPTLNLCWCSYNVYTNAHT